MHARESCLTAGSQRGAGIAATRSPFLSVWLAGWLAGWLEASTAWQAGGVTGQAGKLSGLQDQESPGSRREGGERAGPRVRAWLAAELPGFAMCILGTADVHDDSARGCWRWTGKGSRVHGLAVRSTEPQCKKLPVPVSVFCGREVGDWGSGACDSKNSSGWRWSPGAGPPALALLWPDLRYCGEIPGQSARPAEGARTASGASPGRQLRGGSRARTCSCSCWRNTRHSTHTALRNTP